MQDGTEVETQPEEWAAGKNHEEGEKKAEEGEGDREEEMGVGREREKEGGCVV